MSEQYQEPLSGGPPGYISSGEEAIVSVGQQLINYKDTWEGLKTTGKSIYAVFKGSGSANGTAMNNSSPFIYMGPNVPNPANQYSATPPGSFIYIGPK